MCRGLKCGSCVKTTCSFTLQLILTSSQPQSFFGHSMNHIIQEPSFRGAPTLSRAQGTQLTVTHSSFDHRGQVLCACNHPLCPCNGQWRVCRVGRLWGTEMCATLQSLTYLLRHFPMGALELSAMWLEDDLERVVGVLRKKVRLIQSC